MTLIPADSYYSLPAYQYNDVTFITNSPVTVTGTFSNTLGIILYILTPAQLKVLNHNGNVSAGGYNWTSGPVADLSVYSLNTNVSAGEWNLVFFNPSLYNTTVLGFYTAVTENPT